MPLLTQSDPGPENYGIANAQTTLRQLQDPLLPESLQHQFKGDKLSVKPEIFWSQLRRRFTPGYEDLLDFGVNSGLYDPDDTLERCIFMTSSVSASN